MHALREAPVAADPAYRPDRDLRLVAAAAAGDADAFAVLHAYFVGPITATVERLAGAIDPGGVGDLVQEIFLRLARSLHLWTPARGASLNTWVYTMVRNHCFDALKRRRLRAVSLSGEVASAAQSLGDPSEGPYQQLLAAELHSLVGRALERLPQEQRTILELRQNTELEYEEIAEELGLTLGTVKSRLARARSALRRELADYLAAS
jgi:RNA polymerase sigma-70 factor (ECF subfamily)